MGRAGKLYNGDIKLDALMNISPFLTVNYNCDKTLQWTNQRLQQAGLRSVQTFDLLTVRTGMHDCQCPNHGTEACDCQMVVLLVYGGTMEPVTLILHGNDGQTWLSTPDGPTFRSSLKAQIQQALKADKLISND